MTPITSAPVRAASAATTELSTPPDMATTIRRLARGPVELEIGAIIGRRYIGVRATA